MPEQTEASIEINAPPAEVMEVITDYEAYPDWADGVKSTEILSKDSKGRAKEVAFEVGQMGIGAKYTLRYTYRAKNAGLSWKSTEASGAVKEIQGEYELEPSGDGTTVTYRLSMVPAISLGRFMRRTAEKTIVNTALGGLKQRVEGR